MKIALILLAVALFIGVVVWIARARSRARDLRGERYRYGVPLSPSSRRSVGHGSDGYIPPSHFGIPVVFQDDDYTKDRGGSHAMTSDDTPSHSSFSTGGGFGGSTDFSSGGSSDCGSSSSDSGGGCDGGGGGGGD